MAQYSLRQLQKHLEARRKKLIGMTIGSGLFYKYAVMNQMDLLLVLSASRFRQMGISSLAGSMPFENANRMVLDFAVREIMPNDPDIPVLFGLCATDPTLQLEDFLNTLLANGFAGVCNLPSLSIVDGAYGEALREAGFSYEQEVEAMAVAHRMGLLTVGMVRDAEQAAQMQAAGCDIICVYLGAASGGVLGAKLELTLRDAVELIDGIFAAVRVIRPEAILMIYGGPAKDPSSIGYLLESTQADGFLGGYTFERLLVERGFSDGALRDVFLRTEDGSLTLHPKRTDYCEFLREYVDEHYMEAISFSALAEQLYVSRTYLSALFKKNTGESFMDYLVSYRMHKASNFLINTNLSIQDIISRVGYSDYAHFCKMFKRRMGVPPASYRRQYKNT